MANYTIRFSSKVDDALMRHTTFLARVSIPAATRFCKEFADTLRDMENNPYQFPVEMDPNLPNEVYRNALFAKRYKILFKIEQDNIYLDAVVDCRQDSSRLF